MMKTNGDGDKGGEDGTSRPLGLCTTLSRVQKSSTLDLPTYILLAQSNCFSAALRAHIHNRSCLDTSLMSACKLAKVIDTMQAGTCSCRTWVTRCELKCVCVIYLIYKNTFNVQTRLLCNCRSLISVGEKKHSELK